MSDRCLRDTSRGCNGSAAADLEALLDYLVVQTPDPHQATGESYFWPRRGGGGRCRFPVRVEATRAAAVAALLAAARDHHRRRESTVHPPEPVE